MMDLVRNITKMIAMLLSPGGIGADFFKARGMNVVFGAWFGRSAII